MQSQHQQSQYSDLDWNDTESVAKTVTELFQKIDQLPTSKRDQIVSRLQNDVRFTSLIERFQPQSA